MNAGAFDIGQVGDTPADFCASAGAAIVYVAGQGRSPTDQGILVKRDSPIRTLSDLKGKRIGFDPRFQRAHQTSRLSLWKKRT